MGGRYIVTGLAVVSDTYGQPTAAEISDVIEAEDASAAALAFADAIRPAELIRIVAVEPWALALAREGQRAEGQMAERRVA